MATLTVYLVLHGCYSAILCAPNLQHKHIAVITYICLYLSHVSGLPHIFPPSKMMAVSLYIR